jgi:murein DD-endopeptidase MepM/ murein hydrolase activator NlpD
MQLIITGRGTSSTRVLHLSVWHFVVGSLALLFFVSLAGSLLTYWTISSGIKERWPLVYRVIRVATAEEFASRDRYLRENLDAMAAKLGEVQAKLVRLEALGERVSNIAGVNPREFNLRQPPPAGGLLVPARPLGSEDVQKAIDQLARLAEDKGDLLTVVEARLQEQRIQKMMIPTQQPVTEGYIGSGFGWRIDPFTRGSALHQGLDFVAAPGTPIKAAAGGVVIFADYHPAYGYSIDIDHGNNLVTRYAHAQSLKVKTGDIVKPGQLIALLGSTGRSTGPHLHFEVLLDGSPQDPAKFLAAGQGSAPVAQK